MDVTDAQSDVAPKIFDPIVFKSWSPPDTCLNVFGQEFHVHSAALKLHCEFFLQFLESADKNNVQASGNAQCTYNWVTKVDEHGEGWMLTAEEKVS